jgi:hypothetical protein
MGKCTIALGLDNHGSQAGPTRVLSPLGHSAHGQNKGGYLPGGAGSLVAQIWLTGGDMMVGVRSTS